MHFHYFSFLPDLVHAAQAEGLLPLLISMTIMGICLSWP